MLKQQEEPVTLKPLSKSHIKQMVAWGEDGETNHLLGVNETADYWVRCRTLLGQPNHRLWAIMVGQDRLIGEVKLTQISWRTREAELMVFIGNPNYRGKGFGSKVVKKVLAQAFVVLKLRRVYLRVYQYNARAVRCYLRCGFKKEGVLRNRYRFGGQNRDIYLMYIESHMFNADETEPDSRN